MLADTLFIRLNMRKKHFQITDFNEKYTHYSLWFYGDTIDFHKTLEPHDNHPKMQIPIFKREYYWQTRLEKFAKELVSAKSSIFHIAKVNDSEWSDLEIEFIPIQTLMALLPTIVKGRRWNISLNLLNEFDRLSCNAKLKELADCPVFLGKSPEGHFVASNGVDCLIFDGEKLNKVFERTLTF